MRLRFGTILLATILFAAGYVFINVSTVCNIPLSYRVGSVDERFDITPSEIRSAFNKAERAWEDAAGVNLFDYSDVAEFTINFVFDERQAFADAEVDLRDRLDKTEGTNSEIGDTYESLVKKYDALEIEYKSKTAAYENRLSEYNAKVQEYNQSGGAPQNVYQELQIEQNKLDSEARTVNSLGNRLNGLVEDINRLSEQGNRLVESYNRNVDTYNKTFGDSREFTQGDYQGDYINIYKFSDRTELELVLTHELGHALSLDHVTDEIAVMYHHLGAQPDILTITESDLEEFKRVCGKSMSSWLERLNIRFGI
ncbi:MAG: hypothetical protein ACI9VM_000328 [Candidatus Azotimanducaceae bacterium]|jgi:hypothetical protein